MSDDFLAELEAEIAADLAKASRKSAVETARKASRDMTKSKEVRERHLADYKALQALLEAEQWQIDAVCAMFSEQVCDGCGSTHRTFLQFMERHSMVKKPTTLRWVRVTSARKDIPRETLIQPMTTHICGDCCEDHGFALEGPSRSELPIRDFISTSTSYTQEDINATS